MHGFASTDPIPPRSCRLWGRVSTRVARDSSAVEGRFASYEAFEVEIEELLGLGNGLAESRG